MAANTKPIAVSLAAETRPTHHLGRSYRPIGGRPAARCRRRAGKLDARNLAGTEAFMNITMTSAVAAIGDETGASSDFTRCSVNEASGCQQHYETNDQRSAFASSTTGPTMQLSATAEDDPGSEICGQARGEIRVILWDSFPRDYSG